MKKVIISLLLAAVMIISLVPAAVFAANDKFAATFFPSGKISKPQNAPYLQYEYSETHGDYITVYYYIPEDIQSLAEVFAKYDSDLEFDSVYGTEYAYSVSIQMDGKLDNGPWQHKSLWDNDSWGSSDESMPYYLASRYEWPVHSDETSSMCSTEFSWLTYLDPENLEGSAGWIYDGIYGSTNEYGDPCYHYDLDNHTFSYRYRYVVKYHQPEGEDQFILGEWSDVSSIGKNGTQKELKQLTTLPAPVLSEFQLVAADDTNSARYFIDIPEVYYDGTIYYNVNEGYYSPYYLCAELNVDNKGWNEEYTANPDVIISGYRSTASGYTVNENSSVQVRVRILDQVTGKYSPYSNVIGTKALWENTSTWAEGGIQDAVDHGLYPACLEGADLTKKVTRGEFAAIAVKLYESMSGKTCQPAPQTTFSDSKDPEVLKAYNHGIVAGYKDGTFKPNDLLNRESAATMLGNVYVQVNGYASINDIPFEKGKEFTDGGSISSWAATYVYFMSSNGVISGYTDGSFRPKNIPERGDAYGMCTREAALIIAELMYENLR